VAGVLIYKLMEEKNNTTIENEAWQYIVITSSTTDQRLLSMGKNGVYAYTLYHFYATHSAIQKTNKIWITDYFCRKGLHWGKDKMKIAKKILLDENIIEETPQAIKGKEGFQKKYIKIHFLIKPNKNTLKHASTEMSKRETETNTIDKNINALDKNINNILITNSKSKDLPSKKKRKDFKVPNEVYKEILDAYQKYKGIKLQGAEFGEARRAIKTILYSGRTKKNILDFMQFCSEVEDEPEYSWLKNWTILTIKRKMPEFLAGKFKKVDEDDNWHLVI